MSRNHVSKLIRKIESYGSEKTKVTMLVKLYEKSEIKLDYEGNEDSQEFNTTNDAYFSQRQKNSKKI